MRKKSWNFLLGRISVITLKVILEIIYKYDKENLNIPSRNEKIVSFCLALYKVDMRLICIDIAFYIWHGVCERKCHNLHDFQLIFLIAKEPQNIGLGIFHHTTISGGRCKFNSHDNGSHFMKYTSINRKWKKSQDFLVNELKLQVRLGMQPLQRPALDGIKSFFFLSFFLSFLFFLLFFSFFFQRMIFSCPMSLWCFNAFIVI